MSTVSFDMSPTVVRYDEAAASLRTLTLSCYSDGAVVTPTAGKITIYDDYGTVQVVETTATPGAGKLTYTLDANLTTASAMNWRAQWKISISSVEYVHNALFDFLKYDLRCPVISSDVVSRDAGLNGNWNKSQSSWQYMIDQAWDIVLENLKSVHGIRYIQSMIDPAQIKEMTLQRSLELIYRQLVTPPVQDSKWYDCAERAAAEYQKRLNSETLFIDVDDGGSIDSESTPTSLNLGVYR